jgi:predicted short-subunit dehydrogenase-like oxidoreductase (DUF2520 family)
MPEPSPTVKPSLTIIGPGRLGTALAIALSGRGYSIQTLVGRHLSKLKRSAALLDVPVRLLVVKEIDKLAHSNLTIISTPDDQISFVVRKLSRRVIDRQLPPAVLHTSGALSSEVLSPLANRGWRTGSIHPLVSVSDPVSGANSFKGAYWCIEGDPKATQVGRLLVRDLGGRSFSIRSTAKPLYHAAAVMTSGNLVALFDIAIDMLNQCGLKRTEAQRVLLPLVESTLSNLSAVGPAKALTGTFARGDVSTVERHLAALTGPELKEARTLYQTLGRKALRLAEANGLDRRLSRVIATKLKA